MIRPLLLSPCITTVPRTFPPLLSPSIRLQILEAFMQYATYGATCALGKPFHSLTFNLLLPKIEKIRQTITAGIAATPGGRRIQAAAAQAARAGRLPNNTAEERSGHAILRQVVHHTSAAVCESPFVSVFDDRQHRALDALKLKNVALRWVGCVWYSLYVSWYVLELPVASTYLLSGFGWAFAAFVSCDWTECIGWG